MKFLLNNGIYFLNVSFRWLEQMQDDGDDKVGQYLASILRFELAIALVVSEHILQSTVYLLKYLQGIEYDLFKTTKECRTVFNLLHV